MVKRWNGADHLPAIGNRYNTVLGFNEPYNHNEDPETAMLAEIAAFLQVIVYHKAEDELTGLRVHFPRH